MPIRRSLPLLAVILAASGAEKMAPTPARQPEPQFPTTHLVDRVIPAYGMDSRYADPTSRVRALSDRIHGFVGELEARTMAGKLHPTAPAASGDGDDKKAKKQPHAGPRVQSAEERDLQEMYEELLAADEQLRPADLEGGVPVMEQWDIDACFADIARAADLLRLGLGESAFNDLAAMHQSWLQRYQSSAPKAREAKIQELMKTKKLSKHEAEAELEKTHWEAPYPDARGVVATPAAAPAPAPEAAPAAVPTAKPAKPAPVKSAPLAHPTPPPVATPAPEPEPAATPEPEPAMEQPEPSTPAETPASEEPAAPTEQAAPEPAPAPEPEAPKPAPAPAPAPSTDLPDL